MIGGTNLLTSCRWERQRKENCDELLKQLMRQTPLLKEAKKYSQLANLWANHFCDGILIGSRQNEAISNFMDAEEPCDTARRQSYDMGYSNSQHHNVSGPITREFDRFGASAQLANDVSDFNSRDIYQQGRGHVSDIFPIWTNHLQPQSDDIHYEMKSASMWHDAHGKDTTEPHAQHQFEAWGQRYDAEHQALHLHTYPYAYNFSQNFPMSTSSRREFENIQKN